MGISFTEWIGYLEAFGVLCSFLMRDIRKLRLTNIVGCLFFIVYGFLLDISWLIVITDVAIVIVNIYYLVKQKSSIIFFCSGFFCFVNSAKTNPSSLIVVG